MKFIIFVIDTGSNTGNAQEMEAIDAFNDATRGAGHFVFAAGLGGPTSASIFDFTSENTEQVAGSLFSSTEFYSGFWIIEAESLEIAEDLAKEASHACNRKVELRPFLGS
jgi:hypothetical protein